MILTGHQIHQQCIVGNITIYPFDTKKLNPNSYNLSLHNELLEFLPLAELDMKKPAIEGVDYRRIVMDKEHGYCLQPGHLYLGRTNEYTTTDDYVPMLEGRSSVGRLGISVHATAGFGDVGFRGFWTLEMSCIIPVWVYPDVEICQIYYHSIEGSHEPYRENGKYQGNEGVQTSRMWMDFEGK